MWGHGEGEVPELSEEEVRTDTLKSRLASELKTGQTEILTIVEKLGPTLTSVNAEVRARGVQLLSNILSEVPCDFLTESQLVFIVAFYIDRLKDNHRVIPPILQGVLALLNMTNLPQDSPVKISRALFEHVPCQQQVRKDRQCMYSILFKLATSFPKEIKSIELDFVLGLILSMDGERDPRNLMFLFSILPTFLKSLNLGHVTEEMFEVMACYFPVDFNTPQDDVNVITRNDLAEKLSICLCIVPSFAEFCLPLLLEKLDSSLKLAKVDSLKLLKQSCSSFSAKSFEPHLHPIWQAMQKEITQESDPELKIHALDALSELINTLCADTSNPTISDSFMREVLTTLQSLLIDAKIKSRFETPLHVLLTIAKASEKSCLFIVKNMNSQLVAYFRTVQEDVLKILILDYFVNIFEICKQWDILSVVSEDFKFLVEIVLFTNNSSNTDLKLAGYKTLRKMSQLVSSSEAVMFQDILNFNINSEHLEEVVETSKYCLLALAERHPLYYETFVVELLMLEAVVSNTNLLRKRVDALCCLASIDHFAHKIVDSVLLFMKNSDISVASVVLRSMTKSFTTKELFSDEKFQGIQQNHNLIENLLDWIMERNIYHIDELKDAISNSIVVIMNAQPVNVQNQLYSQLLMKYERIFLENDESILVLEALLNSSKQDAQILNLNVFLTRAFEVAMNKNTNMQHQACVLIANVLNKYISDNDIQQKYEIMKVEISKIIGNDISDESCCNAITLSSWIAKSFLHNGYSDAIYWLSKLVQCINVEKWGMLAAKGIALIMNDDDKSLSKRCHCKINFLYKQKVFQLFLQLNDNVSEPNGAFLQSWCYILQSIPKSVLLMELPKISNIIVECLNLDNPEVLVSTLNIISYLIENKRSICSIQTLLPRCLKLCERAYPARVRAASLQCIFDLANNCATYQLLTHKQDTVIELAKFLDDPKRVVRRVAVKARTRWFLVGAPGEDQEK